MLREERKKINKRDLRRRIHRIRYTWEIIRDILLLPIKPDGRTYTRVSRRLRDDGETRKKAN